MKPTAILTADWHLREDQPKCRIDDFWESQWKKVKFIKELRYDIGNIPILHSGDLFHNWKPSPRLLSFCIGFLPNMYVIPGNHDLPNHNVSLLEKSGLFTLEKAGIISIWGTQNGLGDIFKVVNTFDGYKVGMLHKLINHPQSDTTAESILKKHKQYDLILSGDNHKTFVVRDNNTNSVLVNPGSLTRQTADQIDHTPKVFFWYAEENKVEYEVIPIKKKVISKDHLIKVEERDERINAFVKRLKDDYDLELSFEANLKAYFENNRTRKPIKDMVWESVGGN